MSQTTEKTPQKTEAKAKTTESKTTPTSKKEKKETPSTKKTTTNEQESGKSAVAKPAEKPVENKKAPQPPVVHAQLTADDFDGDDDDEAFEDAGVTNNYG